MNVRDAADVRLGDTWFLVTPNEFDQFASIEVVHLIGGPSANRFEVQGATSAIRFVLEGRGGDDIFDIGEGTGEVLGGEGTDGLLVWTTANLVLTDTTAAVGTGSVRFAGIETVEVRDNEASHVLDASQTTGLFFVRIGAWGGRDTLLGGAGDDAFNIYEGNHLVDGGPGYDLLSVGRDADIIVTDDTVVTGPETHVFSGVERVIIGTGPGAHRLDGSRTTGKFILSLNGWHGDDTLLGGAGNDGLNGGGGNDTYVFGNNWGNDVVVDEAGTDTATFSAVAQPLGIRLGEFPFISDGVNLVRFTVPNTLESVAGGLAADLIIGTDQANTWAITGNNSGRVGNLGFTSFENFVGGTGADTFHFADGAGVSGRIDGRAGADTIDWTALTAPISVNVTGAGSIDGSQGTASNIAGGFDNIENLLRPPRQMVFDGFLPPIGGADGTGGSFAAPLRTFKLGSTIAVKFRASLDGAPVTSGVHTLQARKWTSPTTSEPPLDARAQDVVATGNQFRLNGNEWHFNLDTQGTGMSAGIWQLIATLSDGSRHSAWLLIK